MRWTMLLLLPLAACATRQHARPPAWTAPTTPRNVAFVCEDGRRLTIQFQPASRRAVIGPDLHPPIAFLDQQPSGSGFIYANAVMTLRGKGGDITIIKRGEGAMPCHAADWPPRPR